MTKSLLIAASVLVLVSNSRVAHAQTPANPVLPWGTWFIGTAQLVGSPEKKWGAWAEVQARTDGVFKRYFYNELKGGLTYDLDKNSYVLLGGGRYSTSDYRELSDGPLNVEKRLWLQLVQNQFIGRVKLEHRYRVERRWFAYRGDSSEVRHRIRYRLNTFIPLNKPTMTGKTVFLSVYDEIFLNPKGPVFERNRVYGGLGYQFNDHWVVQAGWVHQANYNLPVVMQNQFIPQNTSAKNNVVLSAFYRLRHRNDTSPVNRLPSQPD
ncbi:DUF2490 domain-containing protein [Hymenobacter sp. GOD-10R]|uniref:DUF2490 domain-containing protein n=1 Tax=Hymenobacter sp. GOD-10R TaxID=3093922 RepID=UPI002D78E1E4|nr:DUF2490 domain-containing protein [Hymenobacter sp. GOD-10R]WRQ30399.1 DUF2490 domain-containing protein [Hymenobacter sp. GOD-10R]